MANRDIVAIGASAGGVPALLFLASKFRADFPAIVLITLHLPAEFRSELDALLSRAGPLPATFGADGERVRAGRIYVAPPSRHLILDDGVLRLGSGPRENHSRPAIDPMFRSTAVCCGSRAIGAVLTGALGDGASGLWALKESGGIAVVQDPRDAAFSEMPETALRKAQPDHVVALAEMPELLQKLVREAAGEPRPVPASLRFEVEVARNGHSTMEDMDRIGRRSTLVCPDCNGVMWEIDEGDLVRFRCHQGHAYTAELMALAIDENLQQALATGLRALTDRVALTQRMERQAQERGHLRVAKSWGDEVRRLEREIETIAKALQRIEDVSPPAAEEALPRARGAG